MTRLGIGGATRLVNDDDREEWVQNEAALYEGFRRSPHTSVREYVRRHRDEIDAVISEAVNREPG